MSTEEKLIENLTRQLELKDRLLDNSDAQIRTLYKQAAIYEDIRLSNEKIIDSLFTAADLLKAVNAYSMEYVELPFIKKLLKSKGDE